MQVQYLGLILYQKEFELGGSVVQVSCLFFLVATRISLPWEMRFLLWRVLMLRTRLVQIPARLQVKLALELAFLQAWLVLP
jgi:hypothetical protein